MLTKLPENSAVYIFGSILYSEKPKDIDVIVVYDPKIVLPQNVYIVYNELVQELFKKYALEIDITFLTISESISSKFIDRANAITYEVAKTKLTKLNNK